MNANGEASQQGNDKNVIGIAARRQLTNATTSQEATFEKTGKGNEKVVVINAHVADKPLEQFKQPGIPRSVSSSRSAQAKRSRDETNSNSNSNTRSDNNNINN